jgi:hypothetical protein
MEHAYTQVKAVEHDIADDHDRNQAEPDETHHDDETTSGRAKRGPFGQAA